VLEGDGGHMGTKTEKSRAREDVIASQERLRRKVNPKCKGCTQPCKQNAAVCVVQCPHYEPKRRD